MPAKKKRVNKSDFVRAQSLTLSAAEVVTLGAKQGIKFTDKYVYTVRSKAKTDAAKGKSTVKMGRPKGSKTKTKAIKPFLKAASDSRTQFVHLALDIGISTAEALLKAVREAVVTAVPKA